MANKILGVAREHGTNFYAVTWQGERVQKQGPVRVLRNINIREGFKKKKGEKYGLLPNRGGVSEGNKKPNPFFGVLKRVKNALKWLKNYQKT